MKILYVKNNSERAKEFQLKTIIYEENGQKFVKKQALCKEAIPHLKKMKDSYKKLNETIINPKIKLAKIIDESEDSLTFEFIDGESLESRFNKAQKQGKDKVDKIICEYKELLNRGFKTTSFDSATMVTDEYKKIFGDIEYSKFDGQLCFEGISNVDLIFSNILYKDDEVYLIDYEWVFELNTPVEYSVYRTFLQKNVQDNFTEESEIFEKNFLMRYVITKNGFYSFKDKYIKSRFNISEQIREKNQQIQEKDQQIQEKDQQIQEKDQQIQEKDQQIQEKDQQVNHLQTVAQSMRIKNRVKRLLLKFSPFHAIDNQNIEEQIVKEEHQHNNLGLAEVVDVIVTGYKARKIDDIIDIIIPVYNGKEYLSPLFESLFSHTDVNYRLIIVNDASPDKSVKELILNKISGRKNCSYFENSVNLGFTETVNFAMSKVTSKFFVILNTDVVVPNQWLSRLVAPFYQDKKIASITPFSNSAVFFSYPVMGEDNKLLPGFTLDEIDRAFQRINPTIDKDCEIHSGVGFCMAMNKSCLDVIGPLDAEAFGKGYGEENDWCMRASDRGWKNILCPNLFVFHNHGGSFNSDEKAVLIEKNSKILHQRWPDAMASISGFVDKNPWKKYRLAASLLLSQSATKTIMIIDFDIDKGGAFAYCKDRIEKFNQEDSNVLLLTHSQASNIWELSCMYGGLQDKISLYSIFELETLVRHIELDEVLINNLIYLSEQLLEDIFDVIDTLKRKNQIKSEYVFHDFLAVCPSFFLLNQDNHFCNLPDVNECKECLKTNHNCATVIRDMISWRSKWKNFLSTTDRLTAFSESTKKLILKIYPDLDIVVKQHAPLVSYTKTYTYPKQDDELTIACFGAFAESKGSSQIRELAYFLEAEKIDAKILLFGNIYTDVSDLPPNIKMMGLYDKSKLPDILISHKVNVVFFASIYPETFSYVVQELMLLKAPIVCFDIGAPAERLREENYERACISRDLSPKAILDCIRKLLKYED